MVFSEINVYKDYCCVTFPVLTLIFMAVTSACVQVCVLCCVCMTEDGEMREKEVTEL